MLLMLTKDWNFLIRNTSCPVGVCKVKAEVRGWIEAGKRSR